jgi:hypothetical protein
MPMCGPPTVGYYDNEIISTATMYNELAATAKRPWGVCTPWLPGARVFCFGLSGNANAARVGSYDVSFTW